MGGKWITEAFIQEFGDQVKKLAQLGCTQEEISSFLKISVDTLMRDDEFCGIYKRGMDKGRMSLRRKQWQAAEDGNTTMLVWLGKQYLKQRDQKEISGKIEHAHKHEGLQDADTRIRELLGQGKATANTSLKPH